MNIENIVGCFDTIVFSIMLWTVYVHIYGVEISFYKKKRIVKSNPLFEKIANIKISIWLILLGMIFVYFFIPKKEEEIELCLILLLCQAFIVVTAKEKKIRNSFLLLPVIATTFLPIAIFFIALDGFKVSIGWSDRNSTLIMYGITIPTVLLIYFLDKKYRFSKRIQKKEKFLVVFISTIVSLFGMGVYDEACRKGKLVGTGDVGALLFLAIALFILFMIIRIISVGTSADYYEELSIIHEKNAKETLALYESYKESQTETRKLRHDMKNHLACIQMLTKEGKYEELQKYLESLNEAVSEVSYEIQTGNEIVDAILNVKLKSAKKEDILFEVTGVIPYMPDVDAIDWCKMIANAIDNGIEALRECSIAEKILQIRFKNNGRFLVIHMENACENPVEISGHGIRTHKADYSQHGFGLKNMEAAVKKYQGEMQLDCEKRGEYYWFWVDLLLPVRGEKE